MVMTGIELLSEYLFASVLYLVAYALFCLKDAICIPGVLLILVVQTLFFLLRKCGKHILLFLLGIVAVTAAVIGGNIQIRYIPATVAITLVTAGYSVVMRCVETMREYAAPQIIQIVFMGIFYLILDIKGNEVTAVPIFWCTFVYVLLFLYAAVDTNMELFLEARKKTTVMDEGQIKNVNRKMTILYVVTAGTGMLLMALFSYRQVYDWIYRLIQRLLLGLQGEQVVEELPADTQTPAPTEMPLLPAAGQKKPWAWTPYIEAALKVLAVIVLAVLAAALIYGIWKALYRGFYKQLKIESSDLEETMETREHLQRRERKRQPLRLQGDARTRVRKLYKRKMYGFWEKDNINKEATTPEEQRRLKDGKISPEVVEIYEKARYSEQEITKEDIRKLKQMTRGK